MRARVRVRVRVQMSGMEKSTLLGVGWRRGALEGKVEG